MKSVAHNPGGSSTASPIEVVPVEGRRDLATFLKVPWPLYRDDPNWVPPLLSEQFKQLQAATNPYFEHAEARYWIARRGRQVVGRISAQVDRLVLEREAVPTGHFGFIEAIDDASVFAALFEAAEGWLRERGMARVTGPFNLSINQESGLLVDGFDTPPRMLMGHARPYYGPRIEALGYTKIKDLYAYHLEIIEGFPKPIQRLLERAERQGHIKLRHLDMKRYDQDLADIIDIFNDAWSENWGFIPLTEAEARADARAMKPLVVPELVYIAEIEGEPVGMMVTLPNLNEAIADLNGRLFPFGWAKLLWRLKVRHLRTSRVVMMGVRKKFQSTALGAAIAFLLIETSRRHGVAWGLHEGELSWILEDNTGMRQMLEAIESRLYKVYRVYEKTLAP